MSNPFVELVMSSIALACGDVFVVLILTCENELNEIMKDIEMSRSCFMTEVLGTLIYFFISANASFCSGSLRGKSRYLGPAKVEKNH